MKAILRFLAVLLVAAPSALAQQTTGDILGSVTDASGALVGQATIVVENEGTHEKRTVESSASGDYVVSLLNPGAYTVVISVPGFKTFTVVGVQLSAGDRTRVPGALVVGSTSETVNVQAEASALQTDSSVLSHTIEEKETQDLPLNGRNFVTLVQLAPGVNEGPPDGLTNGTKLDDHRQSASISVNGQSDVLNNQLIDGADNNERLIGTIGVRPSIESIAEINIQTNSYTAEVGRTGGGVVNVITKSGTDKFHGSAFEFFRNDILDAHSFDFGAGLPKNELRLNQFGGSLGGPIRRTRTFFFADYEGYRQVVGTNPVKSTVPTAYEHNHPGDFSDVPASAATTATFGSCLPACMDAAGLAYYGLLPLPNSGSNQYVGSSKSTQRSNDFDVRIDNQFSAKDSFYARFIYNNVFSNAPGGNGGPIFPDAPFGTTGLTINPNFDPYNSRDLDYNGFLNYVHTFNSNVLLNLKAGYTLADNDSLGVNNGLNPNQAVGQANVNTPLDNATALAPILLANPTTYMGDLFFQPLLDKDNTFQYLGTLLYTKGEHNLKFGATFIRRQVTTLQSSTATGWPLFLSYADLLQGQYVTDAIPRNIELSPPHLRVSEPSVFAQDDWHVSRRLTLNMGLRYDLYTPYREIKNHISTFDPVSGQLLVAGVDGVSNTAGIHTDYHGLSPRFGFAATVAPNLILRGGFGISYVPENSTSSANLKNIPFVSSVNCSFFTCGTFIHGLPAITPSNITDPNVAIGDAVDPHFRTSYFEQFNLTAQKEFSGNVITLSYVGLLGRQLAQLFPDLNEPGPNTCGSDASCYDPLRPYYSVHPNLTTVGFLTSHGSSSYNAVQVVFERRLYKGLSFNTNYSYSHNLDNATGLSEEGAGGYGQDPQNTSTRDYGNSVLDFRQRYAFSANYELPSVKDASGLKGIFGKGWQLNAIVAYTSGFPFTVLNPSTVSNAAIGQADRPNLVGKPTLAHPGNSKFFNTAAFQAQTVGTFGSESRNILHGPSYRHADLSLFRTFAIREAAHLEFRAECFNISNTANFATPVATLGDPNFGVLTSLSSIYAPREFQFALKLTF